MNFITGVLTGGIIMLVIQALCIIGMWIMGKQITDVDFDEVVADEINAKYNAQ